MEINEALSDSHQWLFQTRVANKGSQEWEITFFFCLAAHKAKDITLSTEEMSSIRCCQLVDFLTTFQTRKVILFLKSSERQIKRLNKTIRKEEKNIQIYDRVIQSHAFCLE